MAAQREDSTTKPPVFADTWEAKAANNASATEVMKSFEGFLSFVLSLSIFGASTFAVVVSEIANPSELVANPRFTRETVRTLLGISWLLFIVALYIVAVSMSLLAFQREHAKPSSDGIGKHGWERLGLVASSFIQLLVIAAFLFLSLVLVAYTPAVGWVAVAFTSIAAAFALLSLVIQWIELSRHKPGTCL